MNLISFVCKMPIVLRISLFVVAMAIPVQYCVSFYWHYAEQAWFFQDDFFFILDYEEQLKTWQLISAENFGRFVSRNFYWWGMLKIFGRDAEAFFHVNFLVMLCTAGLMFFFIRPVSAWLAAVAAVAYVVGGGTVANLSWLSNSQHLLAHLLVLAYLLLVSLAYRRNNVIGILATVPVFVLALSSNLLSAIALSWPLLLLTQRPKRKMTAAICTTLILNSGCVLAFIWALRGAQSGAYSTSLALPVLFKSMGHYYGSAVIFILLTALMCSCGVWLLRGRRPLEAWLMFAGPFFLLPFLPLVHQHYLNYAVLSHVFMITAAGYLVLLCEGGKRVAACFLFVTLAFFLLKGTHRQIKNFKSVPRGAHEHALIQTMGEMLKSGQLPSGAIVCFSKAGELHDPDSPLPPYWWGLAFGQAFKAFVHQPIQYVLLEHGASCTHNANVNGSKLRLTLNELPIHKVNSIGNVAVRAH